MKKRVVSMLLIGCLGAALLVGCGNEKTDANAGGDIVDDTELIAVIAAAIAASENTSTDSFVVRSIRRR